MEESEKTELTEKISGTQGEAQAEAGAAGSKSENIPAGAAPEGEKKKPLHMKRRAFLGGFLAGSALMFCTAVIAASLFLVNYVGPEGVAAVLQVRNGGYVAGSGDSALTADAVSKYEQLEEAVDYYYYYASDVTAEQKQDALYKSLFDSLNDPYSTYYTAEEFSQLTADTEGVFYGIGATLTIDTDTSMPKIVAVNSGSPAEKAGILEGDIIVKVDGVAQSGLSLTEVVSKVRGEDGTDVELTIYREGEPDYLTITVTRGKVDDVTVASEMLDDGIGYIAIDEFDEVTKKQFKEALDDLKSQELNGLIIDLRGNPGGNVDAVVDVAGNLLPEGLVFYAEDNQGNRTDYKCSGENEFVKPMAVLVNGYSASASEILTGALQDAGTATVIGTTTYGKGVMQSVIPLNDGSGFKVTTNCYFTRNGRDINHIGITPDIELELDTDAYLEDGTDNQLEKAKEVLKKQIGIKD